MAFLVDIGFGQYGVHDLGRFLIKPNRVGVGFRHGTRCIICTELSTPEPLHENVLAHSRLGAIGRLGECDSESGNDLGGSSEYD